MDPFRVAFLAFVVVIGTVRANYKWRNRRSGHRVHDASLADRAVLAVAVIAMVPIPLLHLFSPVFVAFDIARPAAAGWLGVAMLAAGTWLFWRSHADLGANWSAHLALRSGHDLVDSGVYSRVRHPMYAALIVSGIGQALVLANLIAGFSLLIAATAIYAIRIPREERMMIAAFGDRYRTYMARTGRIFPRFARRAETKQTRPADV